MKTQKQNRMEPKEVFNPTLFWDAEDVDMEKHGSYIIARVLDFGDEDDLKALRRIYSESRIIDVVRKRRGLQPQTGKFWALYFNIPFEEVACLRR